MTQKGSHQGHRVDWSFPKVTELFWAQGHRGQGRGEGRQEWSSTSCLDGQASGSLLFDQRYLMVTKHVWGSRSKLVEVHRRLVIEQAPSGALKVAKLFAGQLPRLAGQPGCYLPFRQSPEIKLRGHRSRFIGLFTSQIERKRSSLAQKSSSEEGSRSLYLVELNVRLLNAGP